MVSSRLKVLEEVLRIKRVRYGIFILLSLAILSIFVILFSPFEYDRISPRVHLPPLAGSDTSWPHILGTDNLGRDVFTRTFYAFALDLGCALAVVILSGSIGLAIGIASSYLGGVIDAVLMRIMDIVISIPGFMLAIAIAAVLGSSIFNAIIAIAIVTIPVYARLVRSVVLSVKESLFVLAAKEAGLSDLYIVVKHVLPHVIPTFITQASMELSNAIIYIAALSFVGLGAQEPVPEWGLMISSARRYVREAWWTAVFPGLVMFLTVLSFNLIGDGLRDYLDPKKRTVIGVQVETS
ncbi:MAG: ABC transporter permease [Desulfurococcaceae archaeon]|jgi:peptide/nickel transport system permease protein|nr:ABC transporter permease [Desulfurococcaceae archaeon]